MNAINFLLNSMRTMRTTGAIARSSKYLSREMLKSIQFNHAKVIVELGAGDGVFTHSILEKMSKDAVLFCFEINPEFHSILQKIDDPRFILINDSAEHLKKYLIQYQHKEVDYIISGIPFVALPAELSDRIIHVSRDALRKNGLFIQFHYSTLISRMYKRIFGNLHIQFVPLNLPPAFVMVCKKM
jgi:phospholipid N-methyltransferase